MVDENHGIPARLRAARMQQGLEIETLARELKNPRAVLESIERGDWSRLGAPVFVRHLVGRYASRLGVPVDLDEIGRQVSAPVLRPRVATSRVGRLAEFSARNAAYVGGTLLVLPLVYAALNWTASGPVEYRPLDPVPTAVVAVQEAPVEANAPTAEPMAPVAPTTVAPIDVDAEASTAATDAETLPATTTPTPVTASLGVGMLVRPAQVELAFSGDSWIEVTGRDGRVLERVLARAGEARQFAVADVGRVTIGNVDATEVRVDGSSVNLDAVRAANVARFALSSDGSIEAVAR